MAGSVFKLSPFKLSMFHQCPRKYRYHYLDGLAGQYGKPRSFFTMGEHVHAALNHFLSPINTDRTAAKLESLLRERWRTNRKGFASIEEEKEYGNKAIAQLQWFCQTQDVRAVPLMREANHEVPLEPGFSILGRIDRVDTCPDDSLHIIDYKTGNRPQEPNQLQLIVYALVLSKRYGRPVSRASYLYLNGDGPFSVEPGIEDLQDAEEEMLASRDRILGEAIFAPNPSFFCRWCDFSGLCEGFAGAPAVPATDDEPDF